MSGSFMDTKARPILRWVWQRCQAGRNRFRSAEAVFASIYRKQKWGSGPGRFCSGGGSSQAENAAAYLRLIEEESLARGFAGRAWLDLGCGDFQIGSRLRPLAGSYTAVDVVGELIAHHRAHYRGLPVEFVHADISGGAALPKADVVFVRQVLQHLSNGQIARALQRLRDYPLVYLTEHHPSAGKLRRPNADMVQGSGIRLDGGSGVCFAEPPFSIPPRELELVLEVPVVLAGVAGDLGVLKTWRYTPGAAAWTP